jgi:hypothetical protein
MLNGIGCCCPSAEMGGLPGSNYVLNKECEDIYNFGEPNQVYYPDLMFRNSIYKRYQTYTSILEIEKNALQKCKYVRAPPPSRAFGRSDRNCSDDDSGAIRYLPQVSLSFVNPDGHHGIKWMQLVGNSISSFSSSSS